MEWQYKIPVPTFSHKAVPEAKWFLLGSCFASHLGDDLSSHFINVCKNPLGIVYHPGSMLAQIRAIVEGRRISEKELRENQDLFSHFLFHSSFSGINSHEVVQAMNRALEDAEQQLTQASLVVITAGTALGYYHNETTEIVSNCHRFPAIHFKTRRITPEECAQIFEEIRALIHSYNPNAKIVLTVSPVKYYREGVREHLLSKSVLLIASKMMEERGFYYFPAYELMTEELRDYRFYAGDFCHPSGQAIAYIVSRFRECMFDEKTHKLYNMSHDFRLMSNHRIMHPGAIASIKHEQKVSRAMQEIIHAFPHVQEMIPLAKDPSL
jgi:hypothetical protein